MNKQRLTKMTARERRLAQTGGCLDETLPAVVQQRLRDDPREFALDPLLHEIGNAVGWLRLIERTERDQLEPKEIAEHARDTAAVIAELQDRLRLMHPDVEGMVDGIIVPALGEMVITLRERVAPDLTRLEVALRSVAHRIERTPSKRGPKRTERDRARDRISDALARHGAPAPSKRDALALADELLALAGSPPRSRRR